MHKNPKTMLDPRSNRGLLLLTVLSGLVAIPAGVLAQSGERRVMVFEDDSGSGPQVLHFAGPNFGSLRKPDFVKRDLPIFREELRLDGLQHAVVGVLLDAYLDSFKLLAEESMPRGLFGGPGMGGPEMNLTLGGPDGEGENIDAMIRDAMKDADLTDVDIEAGGDGTVAIAIMARAGDEGELDMGAVEEMHGDEDMMTWAETSEAADGEGPSTGVFVAVGGPDGVELPDDVREKLEKLAQEMAARLQERLAEAEANGVDLAEQLGAPTSMEDHKARMEEMRKAMERFERQKEALKQDFLTQVQGQLTAEQLGNWPGFERAFTRIKTLPNGRLDGERTDLLVVADNLELNTQQLEAVAEQLESYELALDDALRERNDYVDDATVRVDKAIQDGDFDKALSIVDNATRRRVAVRSVNERYTETIAEKLPEAAAAEFRADAMRRSYPRVYRKTVAQKSFRQARALPGLDEETLEGIKAIEEAYQLELDMLNERIRETIHRYQPKETRRTIERIASVMSGEGGSLHPGAGEADPVREAFARRRRLDERFMKQLHGMLTPEQVAELPELPSERKRSPFIMQRSTASD